MYPYISIYIYINLGMQENAGAASDGSVSVRGDAGGSAPVYSSCERRGRLGRCGSIFGGMVARI
jgi:hypothetical protein